MGPSTVGLLTSSEALSTANLMVGYALKWGGRIDSYNKLKDAFGNDDSYEQPTSGNGSLNGSGYNQSSSVGPLK